MREHTCCFTGHRNFKQYVESAGVATRLNEEIERLIDKGVTSFLSGGARGFDLLAATLVIYQRNVGRAVQLILALPCRGHDEGWPEDEKHLLQTLMAGADEVVYVTEEFSTGCMKARNQYMVDRSAHCICALKYRRSGTGQTVNFAEKAGLNIVNVLG